MLGATGEDLLQGQWEGLAVQSSQAPLSRTNPMVDRVVVSLTRLASYPIYRIQVNDGKGAKVISESAIGVGNRVVFTTSGPNGTMIGSIIPTRQFPGQMYMSAHAFGGSGPAQTTAFNLTKMSSTPAPPPPTPTPMPAPPSPQPPQPQPSQMMMMGGFNSAANSHGHSGHRHSGSSCSSCQPFHQGTHGSSMY